MQKRKIIFIVGEVPTSTFIDRLATGLNTIGLNVVYFAIKHKNIKIPRVKIFGPTYGAKEGRYQKMLFFVLQWIKIYITKPKDKRKVDLILDRNGKSAWRDKFIPYFIINYNPEILHVQWAKHLPKFVWVKEFGIKIVLSLRGSHITYSPISNPKLAADYNKYFPLVDAFHGVNFQILSEAEKYQMDKAKATVIYSGLNLKKFNFDKEQIKQKYSTANKRLNIVSVGRNHWVKGYHIAIDAVSLLKESGFDYSYQIIGAENSEELLFQIEDLDLSNKVHLTTKLPFDKVLSTIKGADLLILPSINEGIANVVLEAMALGTFVISSDCGGMNEAVTPNKTGLLFKNRNSKDLCSKIKEFQKMPPEIVLEMISNARVIIEERFNASLNLVQFKEFYQNL